MKISINGKDDIIKNKNLKKITLNKRVPDEVNPKALPKERKPLAIRKFPFKKDDRHHACKQDSSSIINDVILHSLIRLQYLLPFLIF